MFDLVSSTHGTTPSPAGTGWGRTRRIAMSPSGQPLRVSGELTVASWLPLSTFCWSRETPWPLMSLTWPTSPAALSASGSVSVNEPLVDTMYFTPLSRLAADTTAWLSPPASICGRVTLTSVTLQVGQSLAITASYAVTSGPKTG